LLPSFLLPQLGSIAKAGSLAHHGEGSDHFWRPIESTIPRAQLIFGPNLWLPGRTLFSESGWLFDLTQRSAQLGEGKAPRALLKQQRMLAASALLEAFVSIEANQSLARNSKGNPGELANHREL